MPLDEGILRQRLEDGQQARNVLENPLFQKIMRQINKDFQTAFKGDDHRKAWEARRQVLVLEAIVTKFQSVLAKEKDAISQLEMLKKQHDQDRLGNLERRAAV